VEQLVDFLFEGRQVLLDDLEDAMDVDSEVLMGDQVAKAGDVGPGNLRG
jgi:hypothetical protein